MLKPLDANKLLTKVLQLIQLIQLIKPQIFLCFDGEFSFKIHYLFCYDNLINMFISVIFLTWGSHSDGSPRKTIILSYIKVISHKAEFMEHSYNEMS